MSAATPDKTPSQLDTSVRLKATTHRTGERLPRVGFRRIFDQKLREVSYVRTWELQPWLYVAVVRITGRSLKSAFHFPCVGNSPGDPRTDLEGVTERCDPTRHDRVRDVKSSLGDLVREAAFQQTGESASFSPLLAWVAIGLDFSIPIFQTQIDVQLLISNIGSR